MAGAMQAAGETSENPVAINVTAMVDVIFCLCIFFMCSFHFKALEGRIETWLPDNRKGVHHGSPPVVQLEEIRIFMQWDAAARATIRQLAHGGPALGDRELMGEVRRRIEEYRRVGRTDVPVILDATPDVPWQDVVRVMDLCKLEKIDRIELTEPMQYTPRTAVPR